MSDNITTIDSLGYGSAAERNRVLRNTYWLLSLSMIPTILGAWIGVATGLAGQSGEALRGIVDVVTATADQVNAIAAASEEQSAASEEINRSIVEVNEVSRLTAEAMNQASAAVADLTEQAKKLAALIQEMQQG